MPILKNAQVNENGKILVSQRPVTLVVPVDQKTSNTTVAVPVKTTVHSLTFLAPDTGAVEIDGLANASLGNNVTGTWFVEIYLSGVLVGASSRVFSNHGRTANPLNGAHLHIYPSGLTPGVTYEARISVTPTGGTINIRSATNPTTEQAQLAVKLVV